MKRVQKGIVLYENDETSVIYSKFKEFFDVVEEYEWLKKYVISKDPSPELIHAIEDYYAKVKERNRKHDEFVDSVAKEVLGSLTDEEKAYIYDYPDSTTHHFGLGLGIRNKYIHGQDLDFEVGHPDDLSSAITSRISSLIIEDYDYENPYYRHLYGSFVFGHLRRLYRALTEEYPDCIIDKYADLPDDSSASLTAEEEIRAIVLNSERFKELSQKYGLSDEQYHEYHIFVDEYNNKNWDIIPYDVALLGSKKLEPENRSKYLKLMQAILKQAPRMALEIPAFVFNQKDAVLLAVTAYGKSLKRFKRFNSDNEIIIAALTDNGEAIQYVNSKCRHREEYIRLALSSEYGNALKMRCMIPYRDQEEMVKIALEANGCNIQWASPRLKDDFEIAAFAVRHQKDWYPESTVCNLSARLRDNLDIALIDIQEGHACVGDYSNRLRDNDEVAQALINSEHSWKIYQMSKRIQKKYDKEQ